MQTFLDELYNRYNHPSYLSSDPLGVVLDITTVPSDIEWIAFFVSVCSYGRVDQIRKVCHEFFRRTGSDFTRFLFNARKEDIESVTHGIHYRFYKSEDFQFLIRFLQTVIRSGKTLRQFIQLKDGNLDDSDLTSLWKSFQNQAGYHSHGSNYMVPDDRTGSARKRLWMFYRWMIRKDHIDPGIWTDFPARVLIFPLDTHTTRICYYLGLSDSRVANKRNAMKITNNLRQFSAEDPVKYDFAISRLGILQECPTRYNPQKCGLCTLSGNCSR